MNIVSQAHIDSKKIVSALEGGETIVYPTETCYGLGCDATNTQAVETIFTIKQRQKEKSLLVLMADVAMAMRYVDWTPRLEQIARQYWPGPLTVVVPVKASHDLAPGVVRGDGTIAFRITDHYLAEELVRTLGKPLVSTSANISDLANPYDIDTVLAMYQHTEHQPDIIIDGGHLAEHAPSTIIQIIDETIEVLRQGEVVVERSR